MSQSEIAQFRERQQLEEQSAQLALSGMAAVARHEAIIQRMNQGAETLVPLFEQGRYDEAFALWNAGILETGTLGGIRCS